MGRQIIKEGDIARVSALFVVDGKEIGTINVTTATTNVEDLVISELGSGIIGTAVGDMVRINNIRFDLVPWDCNVALCENQGRKYSVGDVVWNGLGSIGVITLIDDVLIRIRGNAFKDVKKFDLVINVLEKVEENDE